MKKFLKQLRQPNKYTHQFLRKKSQEQCQSEEMQVQEGSGKGKVGSKHKIIQKEKEKYVRKVINKPNQPSALRLEQINSTFNNLSEKSQFFMEDLNINHELLRQLIALKEKFTCGCNRKVKFYCLKCYKKCSLLDVEQAQLPLDLHVLHHTSQNINKSSVVPLNFLTKNIKIYPYSSNVRQEQSTISMLESLPKYGPNTFILYPHKKSKTLKAVNAKIQNLIILDCTWFQTDQIIESLEDIGYNNFLKLEGYESIFWRYNHYGQQALSSAQSVMYFFREYQQKQGKQVKQYDKLMFLYALNMKMVGKSIRD